MSAIDDMVKAFDDFEDALESAQRQQHNYQYWDAEQLDPLQAARDRFYEAAARARAAQSESDHQKETK